MTTEPERPGPVSMPEPGDDNDRELVDPQLIDELLEHAGDRQLLGEGGLLQQLTKQLLETALDAVSTPSIFRSEMSALFPTGGSWFDVLADGLSFVAGVGDEVVQLAGESVGGGPAEVVGDGHGARPAAQPHDPDAVWWAAIGTGVGVVDLHLEAWARRAARGPAGRGAVDGGATSGLPDDGAVAAGGGADAHGVSFAVGRWRGR